MMTKYSVNSDYSKLADNDIGLFCQKVYDALNPNVNFTWEETVMPKFQTDITTYQTLLEKAFQGTPADTIAKNESRDVLIEDTRAIALEVNIQGNNDVVILQSSGLTLSKGKSKIGVLPKPTNFTVKTGSNSGEFLCDVKANSHALTYNFYFAPVPAPSNITDWRLSVSSTRKKNLSGFIPGVQYEVKCAYQGSEDTLVFSDSILIYAQ